jgi:hypothetical protein
VIELERVITNHANKPASEPIAAYTFCSCDAPRPTYHLAEGTAIRARRSGAAHSPAATWQGTNMAWRGPCKFSTTVRYVHVHAWESVRRYVARAGSLALAQCSKRRQTNRGVLCKSTPGCVCVCVCACVCVCVCVCVCACVCMSTRTYLPCHSQPGSQGSVLRSLFSPATRPKCGRAHRPDAKSRVSQSSTTAASMVAPDK